jgi:hypothetical protein
LWWLRKPLQNLGASVRARLLNLAKERNQPFELLLNRYTLECAVSTKPDIAGRALSCGAD